MKLTILKSNKDERLLQPLYLFHAKITRAYMRGKGSLIETAI